MERFEYLLVMAACVAVTVPLEVLGARVYRRPVRLVRTLLPTLLIFLAWDVFAIARGHWTFSARYTTGWLLPLGVPVEELVFFLVIPVCALLTYESVDRMLLRARHRRAPGTPLSPETDGPERSGSHGQVS